jgi:hypothetical protein
MVFESWSLVSFERVPSDLRSGILNWSWPVCLPFLNTMALPAYDCLYFEKERVGFPPAEMVCLEDPLGDSGVRR